MRKAGDAQRPHLKKAKTIPHVRLDELIGEAAVDCCIELLTDNGVSMKGAKAGTKRTPKSLDVMIHDLFFDTIKCGERNRFDALVKTLRERLPET